MIYLKNVVYVLKNKNRYKTWNFIDVLNPGNIISFNLIKVKTERRIISVMFYFYRFLLKKQKRKNF